MVEECVCGHYRTEHESHGDHCEYEGCDCPKFRLSRVFDLRAQLQQAQERAEAAEKALFADTEADEALIARVLQAEALVEKGQQLRDELEEVGNYAVGIIWDGALLAEWDALKIPAEAQEEGDGD